MLQIVKEIGRMRLSELKKLCIVINYNNVILDEKDIGRRR